jgi:hypothetical protein
MSLPRKRHRSCGCRTASRSGICLLLGPTTSSTSASISSCRTPSPTPTDNASSPSFAAPASSPSASIAAGVSPSMLSSPAATDAAVTVLMAVGPPVLVDFDSHSPRSQPDRTRREDRRLSSSTSYGTTSERTGDTPQKRRSGASRRTHGRSQTPRTRQHGRLGGRSVITAAAGSAALALSPGPGAAACGRLGAVHACASQQQRVRV